MATQFSTHPVAAQPGPYQQHAYKSSANYTMQSGHNTRLNSSPTSPRSTTNLALHPNNAPQLRPRQQPIYVPAALRRTEKPVRQSPPQDDSAVETPNSSWTLGAGFSQSPGEPLPGGIGRIATEDLHSLNNDVPLSPVSGPITRNHWKVCSRLFSSFRFVVYAKVSFYYTPPLIACPCQWFAPPLSCYARAMGRIALALQRAFLAMGSHLRASGASLGADC